MKVYASEKYVDDQIRKVNDQVLPSITLSQPFREGSTCNSTEEESAYLTSFAEKNTPVVVSCHYDDEVSSDSINIVVNLYKTSVNHVVYTGSIESVTFSLVKGSDGTWVQICSLSETYNKGEVVAEVLSSLPTWQGGSY